MVRIAYRDEAERFLAWLLQGRKWGLGLTDDLRPPARGAGRGLLAGQFPAETLLPPGRARWGAHRTTFLHTGLLRTIGAAQERPPQRGTGSTKRSAGFPLALRRAAITMFREPTGSEPEPFHEP